MTDSKPARRDPFFFLGEINKASTVMVVEQEIVPRALGKTIADAVRGVIAAGDQPGAARASNYLVCEEALIALAGPEVTRLHSGRSRQDIGATIERLASRDQLMAAAEGLIRVRRTLLTFAAAHRDAILPAYTWGVQAQPISFGHYCTAYCAAFTRTSQRVQETYRRLNLSPLGSGALGTSSFPVDRARLAALLGMDGLVVNSLDATQISPIDCGSELASIAISAALTIGGVAADITAQYSHAHPWLVMDASLTGGSSIMPQKRNPRGLVFLRAQASNVIGLAQTFFLLAHNVQPGMSDYKPFVDAKQGHHPVMMVRELVALLGNFGDVLGTIRLDEARALDEVDADYSMTTELADILQRDCDIPFRVGHHFASDLVDYGRRNKLRPRDISYDAARGVYTESAAACSFPVTQLPLSEADFRRAMTAQNMVASSRGTGGPQPDQVVAMLAAEQAALQADQTWIDDTQARQAQAARALDAAFEQLRSG